MTSPRLALIAHDGKKTDIITLAKEFLSYLSTCELCATGTTGQRLMDETGLQVERLLSGPFGGDLQIGSRIAMRQVDAIIFLRDPMTSQPHEPDINALVRACDVHNLPCATNLATARLVLQQLQALKPSSESALSA
ncbi:MAG: methylglyoxal synthase [Polaromonas sp.]|nr:methylglyoxal synthase [Polaromonas sp.]